MSSRLPSVAILNAVSLLYPACLEAQDTAYSGQVRITGRVIDLTSGPLPGTTVTVVPVGFKSPIAKVLSDETGKFSVHTLLPQRYELRFDLPGFRSGKMQLTADSAQREIDLGPIILEIGETTEGPFGTPIRLRSHPVMSVCDVLRRLKQLDGRDVRVRGEFNVTSDNRAWLSDESIRDGHSCDRVPKDARSWPSIISIDSPQPTEAKESSLDFSGTVRGLVQRRRNVQRVYGGRILLVTLTGQVRTIADLATVPSAPATLDTGNLGPDVTKAAATLSVSVVGDILLK